jgi:DNA polymerase III delta subunit
MGKLFLIVGNDEYNIRKKSSELIKGFCGENYNENPCLDIIHGDQQSTKPAVMLNQVTSAIKMKDLFGGMKTIWLKRFDFSSISKSKDNKAATENLSKEIKKGLPDDINLIMDGSAIDKRSALYKACKKIGNISELTKINVDTRDWEKNVKIKIQEICRANNLSITPDALEFLSSTCGTDSGRFTSEILKLQSYIFPENKITLNACRSICSFTPEAAGWAFADTLVQRNLKESLSTLNILFNNKAFGNAVIYTVVNRFQEILKIKVESEVLGVPDNASKYAFDSKVNNIHPQLKEKHKGMFLTSIHPYRAWMLYSQASRFTNDELASILTAILKVNKDLVSGGSEPRIALELLAAQICKRK